MKKFLCFILLFLISSFLTLQAQVKSAKVRQLERQRKEVLRQINETDKELKQTRKNKSNEEKRLKLVKKLVVQRQQMVKILDGEVQELQLTLNTLTRQRDSLLKREDACKRQYAKSVVSMQKRSASLDRLLFLFSASSFDKGVRREAFLNQYARAHRQAASELKDTRQLVEKNRNEISTTHSHKADLLAIRESEKKKLEAEQKTRTAEVKQLSGQQKTLEQKLRKQKSQVEALNRKIEQQIAFEIAEAERKAREEQERLDREAKARGAKAAPKAERKAAVKGGYAMNAEERALSSNFASNKGRLPSPVRGRYDLVGQYGVHSVQGHSRVRTSSGGIDLRVVSDHNAYCVFNGVVTSIFMVNGFNNSVIVRHGNYLTVYSNLVSVSVSKGQKVKTGQVLGRIATDSNTRETILHFQIWKERTKQNPSAWIK